MSQIIVGMVVYQNILHAPHILHKIIALRPAVEQSVIGMVQRVQIDRAQSLRV